jgi:hypothetical protein
VQFELRARSLKNVSDIVIFLVRFAFRS